MADSASTHSYKHDRCTRMKYPWVIGFGLLLPKPIPVYPMGGDFVPDPYPWGQFLSHTRTLIGEFPTGYRVPIDISTSDLVPLILSLYINLLLALYICKRKKSH
jgi:hypothetical protein